MIHPQGFITILWWKTATLAQNATGENLTISFQILPTVRPITPSLLVIGLPHTSACFHSIRCETTSSLLRHSRRLPQCYFFDDSRTRYTLIPSAADCDMLCSMLAALVCWDWEAALLLLLYLRVLIIYPHFCDLCSAHSRAVAFVTYNLYVHGMKKARGRFFEHTKSPGRDDGGIVAAEDGETQFLPLDFIHSLVRQTVYPKEFSGKTSTIQADYHEELIFIYVVSTAKNLGKIKYGFTEMFKLM